MQPLNLIIYRQYGKVSASFSTELVNSKVDGDLGDTQIIGSIDLLRLGGEHMESLIALCTIVKLERDALLSWQESALFEAPLEKLFTEVFLLGINSRC